MRVAYFLGVLTVPFVQGFMLDTFFGKPPTTVPVFDVSNISEDGSRCTPVSPCCVVLQMYASQSVVTLWEQGATCVTADYLMGDNGRVTVLNSERLGAGNGSLKVIHGYAEPGGEPGKFSVYLEGVPVGANYWVLKLGPATFGSKGQYQYAVVSDIIRGTLFVLARDPDVFKRDYDNEVTTFLDNNGFTSFYNNRVVTYHGNDCVYNKDHQ